MTKIRLQTMALLAFVAITLTSCLNADDDNDTISPDFRKNYVTNVTGPATASINQQITLAVSYNLDGTCGGFSKFIETVNGNTTVIEVEAGYLGSCPNVPTPQTVPYKFKSTTAGTFTLKFVKSATETIDKVIVVE